MIASVLVDIVENKKEELVVRKKEVSLEELKNGLRRSELDFCGALRKGSGRNVGDVALIAEIKQASPSEGVIRLNDFDAGEIAGIYEKNGASCVSVLTDRNFFGGNFGNLEAAREGCGLPILCKDFFIDEYQVYEARSYGADAILLIAAVLSVDEMGHLFQVAKGLGMDAIFEVHDEEELKKVLEVGGAPEIIGINNRNLHNFEVDMDVTRRLSEMVPEEVVVVSESGIGSREDIDALTERVDAVLVGTSIMRSKDVGEKVRELCRKT